MLADFDPNFLQYLRRFSFTKVSRDTGVSNPPRSSSQSAILGDSPDAPVARVDSPSDLPQALGRFFLSVHLWRLRPEDPNIGINLNRASSFDPDDAVQALLNELHDKLVTNLQLYTQSKTDRGLKQLWLIVHYGRGLMWNTPYHGIGLKEGQPLDEQTSRQIIARRAREFISAVGAGAFDKVFLFFDMTPGLQVLEVWP